MSANQLDSFNEFKSRRDQLRPTVVGEPKWVQGVFYPSLVFRANETPEQFLSKGVMVWTRIAMATVLTSGDALGWERFFEVLQRDQLPVSKSKAARLMKEFNITGESAADAVNLMVTWAKGDLFNWHRHPYVTEHELMGVGTWCPQVTAVEEMGMGQRAQNMRLWCDFYDKSIAESVNHDIRMVHANCPSSGDKYCMFYIFEEKDPPKAKADNTWKTISFFNDRKRAEIGTNATADYMEGMAAPRNIEGWSEAAKLKDGIITKARIAIETLLVAGVEYGWTGYMDKVVEEQTWGYREEALKLKRDYNINGESLRDAANLLTIGYGMMGFDDHSITTYTPEKVEGVATKCQIIDAAKDLGLADKLKDVSVWCDFYHNHKVHAVNEKYQLTHTHCLGCGDKYCRFVLKAKEEKSKS